MARMINRSRRNPSFMKLLFTNFTKKLLIPPKFVRLHRGTLAEKCTLKPTGTQSSWPVRTKLIDNHLYFKRGWKAFAQHHSLQFGDMLIFRYAQDFEFYVDMFDKTCCSREPANTASILPSGKNQKHEQCDVTLESSNPESTPKSEESSDKAFEEAEKFQSISKHPSFLIVMHPAYVEHRYLHVPLTFVKEMRKKVGVNYKMKLRSSDKEWNAIMKNVRGKCSISKGWVTFVKDRSIEVGDVCVLELINREDDVIRISIFKCNS